MCCYSIVISLNMLDVQDVWPLHLSFSAFCTWNSILKIQCISLKKFNSLLITLPFSTILLPASRVFHCKYPCFVNRDMFYVTVFSIIGVLSNWNICEYFYSKLQFLEEKIHLGKTLHSNESIKLENIAQAYK